MNNLVTWPAPENNKAPILEKLEEAFAEVDEVLEIGSGTAQHAVHFAPVLSHLSWQTSDCAEYLPLITERLDAEGAPNICAPLELDVDGIWPQTQYDGVYCANSIHIMGWDSVESLFGGVGGILKGNARLVLYGPFKYGGEFTTESNARFDEFLKSQDAKSGIRDFEAVDALARAIGLSLMVDHALPANNQLIVWGN